MFIFWCRYFLVQSCAVRIPLEESLESTTVRDFDGEDRPCMALSNAVGGRELRYLSPFEILDPPGTWAQALFYSTMLALVVQDGHGRAT